MVNFLRYKLIYLIISLSVISVGLFSIFKWGYSYSIDFVGGTNLEYKINKNITKTDLTKLFKDQKIKLIDMKINKNNLVIRTEALNEKKESLLKSVLEKKISGKITVLKSETVGPILGKETMNKTLTASLLAICGILIYMSFAFKGFNYAFSAVIAMIHDFLVVIGCYSILSHFWGAQVDTMFVTAVLTTMTFSVHDTIVIFDKIREYIKEEGKGNIEDYANKALTQTMVRSVNNSMTIIFMLLALSLLGGDTIKYFALTLLIGTITGSYSSPFVATPILVWLERRKNKR